MTDYKAESDPPPDCQKLDSGLVQEFMLDLNRMWRVGPNELIVAIVATLCQVTDEALDYIFRGVSKMRKRGNTEH